MDRETFASWLQGPRAATNAGDSGDWPGERLGLPASGRGSAAPFGTRLLALLIDWIACLMVALLLSRAWLNAADGELGNIALLVFACEVALLTWLGGASFGQRLRRLRVARLDGRPVGLVASVIRTLLLCLVIPAIIYDRDGRGLHDRAVGTVVVRLR